MGGGSDGKASAHNAGDLGSIPGSGRSPGEGNGNLLQYSCLDNSMDWRSLVGYSPWSCKGSETTEQLHFHFIKDDTGWDARRIKNRSSFCLKSISHKGSHCREEDTPVCLYSPLIYIQKKPLNVTWEDEDVLRVFPLIVGQ